MLPDLLLIAPIVDEERAISAELPGYNDQLTATYPSLDQLTMHDKHAAHRNLHMVTLPTSKPGTPTPQGGGGAGPQPKTFLVDFHNVHPTERAIDIELRASDFPGHLSLVLPRVDLPASGALHGVRVEAHSKLEVVLSGHLSSWLAKAGEWIEQLGEEVEQAAAALGGTPVASDLREVRARKVATLDRTRVFVVEDRAKARLAGIRLPAAGRLTTAITVRAADDAKPGDQYRLDVIQRSGSQIVGGSSYILVVTKP